MSGLFEKKRKLEIISSFENIPLNNIHILFYQGQNICNFRDIHFNNTWENCQTEQEKKDFLYFVLHIGTVFSQIGLCTPLFFKDKKKINFKWNNESGLYEEWIYSKEIIEKNILFLVEHGHPNYRTNEGNMFVEYGSV